MAWRKCLACRVEKKFKQPTGSASLRIVACEASEANCGMVGHSEVETPAGFKFSTYGLPVTRSQRRC